MILSLTVATTIAPPPLTVVAQQQKGKINEIRKA
jgi:hypothetical protein